MNFNESKRPWILIKKWISPAESNFWKDKLIKNLQWKSPLVKVYGKNYRTPRKTVFLGENGISYRYSGTTHLANGWPYWFNPLLDKTTDFIQTKFNGCLLNLYRDGNDKMGWHSDNEIELEEEKPIASLSFGEQRDFVIKHKKFPIKEILSLEDGDLLIMYNLCQKEWLHCVPARKKKHKSRINLTFRCYKKIN